MHNPEEQHHNLAEPQYKMNEGFISSITLPIEGELGLPARKWLVHQLEQEMKLFPIYSCFCSQQGEVTFAKTEKGKETENSEQAIDVVLPSIGNVLSVLENIAERLLPGEQFTFPEFHSEIQAEPTMRQVQNFMKENRDRYKNILFIRRLFDSAARDEYASEMRKARASIMSKETATKHEHYIKERLTALLVFLHEHNDALTTAMRSVAKSDIEERTQSEEWQQRSFLRVSGEVSLRLKLNGYYATIEKKGSWMIITIYVDKYQSFQACIPNNETVTLTDQLDGIRCSFTNGVSLLEAIGTNASISITRSSIADAGRQTNQEH